MSLRAPWLVIGDFNEVMWSFEHFSSTRRRERQMLDFREVLSYCDL
jgi:endonuclease/exonuclease/phosphatase (EEP) superfamily protein YafD